MGRGDRGVGPAAAIRDRIAGLRSARTCGAWGLALGGLSLLSGVAATSVLVRGGQLQPGLRGMGGDVPGPWVARLIEWIMVVGFAAGGASLWVGGRWCRRGVAAGEGAAILRGLYTLAAGGALLGFVAMAGMALRAVGGAILIDCTVLALPLAWESLKAARRHRDAYRALGPGDAESAEESAARRRRRILVLGGVVSVGILVLVLGIVARLRELAERASRVRQVSSASTWRPALGLAPPRFTLHPSIRSVGASSGVIGERSWAMGSLTPETVQGAWLGVVALVAGGPDAATREAAEFRAYDDTPQGRRAARGQGVPATTMVPSGRGGFVPGPVEPDPDGAVIIRIDIVGDPKLPHLEVESIARVTAVASIAPDGSETPWNDWVLVDERLAIRSPIGPVTLEVRAVPAAGGHRR